MNIGFTLKFLQGAKILNSFNFNNFVGVIALVKNLIVKYFKILLFDWFLLSL